MREKENCNFLGRYTVVHTPRGEQFETMHQHPAFSTSLGSLYLPRYIATTERDAIDA